MGGWFGVPLVAVVLLVGCGCGSTPQLASPTAPTPVAKPTAAPTLPPSRLAKPAPTQATQPTALPPTAAPPANAQNLAAQASTQAPYLNLRRQLAAVLRQRIGPLQRGDQLMLNATRRQLEVLEDRFNADLGGDQSPAMLALRTAVSSARSHLDDPAALQADLDALMRDIP